jgi:hypothetical protein
MADGVTIRRVLLEVMQANANNLQSRSVLEEAARQLRGVPHQAILTVFGDFFRTGHVAWGYNISNPDPPFMHITEQGRRALAHLSRDPFNTDGYLAHLDGAAQISPIARSYVEEALRTWVADCHKASAVMIGAASERLILDVRDALVARMQSLGQAPSNDLTDWRIGRVLRAIDALLDPRRNTMPGQLREAFDAFWSAFTGQIRLARNDAGHPVSIDPVTQERVHASLLIFPELAALATGLADWISANYS